jgi:4-oxalocrotonate tautomerase family enzyme
MPLVKIEIAKGKSNEYLSDLMQVTMNCVQEVLQLPSDDRNIRLNEFEKDHFFTKPPYSIIIEITLFSGRTVETKRKLYQMIVDRLQHKLEINKQEVFVVLNEQPKENWGIRGGIPASDLDPGFKIEI